MARARRLTNMSYLELSELELRIARLKTEKQNAARDAPRRQRNAKARERGRRGCNTAIPKIPTIPGPAAVACRAGWWRQPKVAREARTTSESRLRRRGCDTDLRPLRVIGRGSQRSRARVSNRLRAFRAAAPIIPGAVPRFKPQRAPPADPLSAAARSRGQNSFEKRR